jgi:Ca-activated chloride channel family protein
MPETMTLPGRAGLYSTGETPVALTGVSVAADIVGLCARVVITQRYENREADPIEAVYVFPLDEGAAVCGFDVLIGGALITGRAMDRDEAFAKYDDALQEGHGAYLLDEERPDVFQASIGNLPPGRDAIVRITYVRELEVDGGLLRFVLPTTVAPRYAPASDRTGIGRSDADALNPPLDIRVPYGLDLTVGVSIPAIERIESPSHPIAMSMAGGKTTVTLAAASTVLDRDFVLAITSDALSQPWAWQERDGDGHAAIAVGFVPVLPATTEPAEVVFVVDESGSMQGGSIGEVRNALQLCLRSMTKGCRFNIVSFGSDFEALFPESRPYEQHTLDIASGFVTRMSAERGGTEILPVLRHVLGRPTVGGLRRQVVIMTDGQVTNTDEVIALAREHSKTTRVFTFGIGAGPSRHLVQGLARAGRGAAEFIAPGERIEPKVLRLFGRLLAPAIDDVAVDWGGLEVVQAPATLPPLMNGMRLLAYGLVSGLKAATLTLTGTSAGGAVRFEIPLDPSAVAEGRTVGTLAARARIRELEESPEWTGARRSRQGRTRGAGQVSREIVDLAVRYNLASRETSLVAIERRETPVTGDLQLRRVPIQLTSGWGHLERMRMDGATRAMGVAGRARSVPDVDVMPAPRRVIPSFSFEAPSFLRRSVEQVGGVFSRSAPDPEAALRRRVVELASLQRADGSWPLARPLADILERSLRDLETSLPPLPGGPLAREAWATALALAWLESMGQALEHEWRLLAAKAERWLDANVPQGDLRELARRLLG